MHKLIPVSQEKAKLVSESKDGEADGDTDGDGAGVDQIAPSLYVGK